MYHIIQKQQYLLCYNGMQVKVFLKLLQVKKVVAQSFSYFLE